MTFEELLKQHRLGCISSLNPEGHAKISVEYAIEMLEIMAMRFKNAGDYSAYSDTKHKIKELKKHYNDKS